MTFLKIKTVDVATPALLLDPLRMERNIARMQEHIARRNVTLRPHIKTVKCLDIIERLAPDYGPVTVSTLKEAECLAQAGYRDILYAVGITPNKIERVQALRRQGVDLKVIVDNRAAVLACGSAGSGNEPIPTLIEIDCDGHRAGVQPDDLSLLKAIAADLNGTLSLAGVITHAGNSYSARTNEELRAFSVRERNTTVAAANLLRQAGHHIDILSIGSTPSALFSEDMTGITEARAGVFAFFDLVMAGIGVCVIDDIALSVLATVSTAQPDRGRYIIDAGWTALSRDRGTARQRVDQGYGLVCDVHGIPYPDLLVTDVSQEHGVIALREGSVAKLPLLNVGDYVRILPNHACATSSQHSSYLVTDGDSMIVDQWHRFGGW